MLCRINNFCVPCSLCKGFARILFVLLLPGARFLQAEKVEKGGHNHRRQPLSSRGHRIVLLRAARKSQRSSTPADRRGAASDCDEDSSSPRQWPRAFYDGPTSYSVEIRERGNNNKKGKRKKNKKKQTGTAAVLLSSVAVIFPFEGLLPFDILAPRVEAAFVTRHKWRKKRHKDQRLGRQGRAHRLPYLKI